MFNVTGVEKEETRLKQCLRQLSFVCCASGVGVSVLDTGDRWSRTLTRFGATCCLLLGTESRITSKVSQLPGPSLSGSVLREQTNECAELENKINKVKTETFGSNHCKKNQNVNDTAHTKRFVRCFLFFNTYFTCWATWANSTALDFIVTSFSAISREREKERGRGERSGDTKIILVDKYAFFIFYFKGCCRIRKPYF